MVFTKETLNFMTTFGEITTGVNVLVLGVVVICLSLIALHRNDFSDDDARPAMFWVIPSALSTAYVAWVIVHLVFADSNLASLVGFAAFLRMIMFF